MQPRRRYSKHEHHPKPASPAVVKATQVQKDDHTHPKKTASSAATGPDIGNKYMAAYRRMIREELARMEIRLQHDLERLNKGKQ